MGDRVSFGRYRDALTRDVGRNEASFRLDGGRIHLEAHVSVTTPGLLAIGGMVSAILLSTAAIVWVSTRKLPDGTLPRGSRRN